MHVFKVAAVPEANSRGWHKAENPTISIDVRFASEADMSGSGQMPDASFCAVADGVPRHCEKARANVDAAAAC
jgi:hypothetical protein